MNRSTTILGFALLAVAATMAAMITLRNRPAPAGIESYARREMQASPNASSLSLRPSVGMIGKDSGAVAEPSHGPAKVRIDPQAGAVVGQEVANQGDNGLLRRLKSRRQPERRNENRESFRVSLSEEWLASLPPEQQVMWRSRVEAVDRAAGAQLAKLTEKLDLTPAQQKKIFPSLVRVSPGYDSAMTVEGTAGAESTVAATPAEEIHAALDPDQQAVVEDEEVMRHLWWEDIINRLEADLTTSTGGAPMNEAITGDSEETQAPADQSREIPETRDDFNLFDLIEPVR